MEWQVKADHLACSRKSTNQYIIAFCWWKILNAFQYSLVDGLKNHDEMSQDINIDLEKVVQSVYV